MSERDAKTEKPTPKRRREARRKGQVARSPELSSWLSMLVAGMLLPPLFHSAESRILALLATGQGVIARPDAAGALRMLGAGLTDVLYIVLPVALGMAGLGAAANIAQVGLHITPKAATPKLSRLNPLAGLRRLISPNSAWEAMKALLKLVVVALVAWRTFSSLVTTLAASASVDLASTARAVAAAVLSLLRSVGAAGLAMAVADYIIQRRRLMTSLKMTKQEVKDENRQAEGDPQVKGQIRQRQLRMSRMRMMAEVARADAVVVNPTHYAVAIRYDTSVSSAPRVVAKGTDHVALRIRELAVANRVPVIEDPPLARALHGACELDADIPYNLYMAVARLLAFVYKLPVVARGSVVTHSTPAAALAR